MLVERCFAHIRRVTQRHAWDVYHVYRLLVLAVTVFTLTGRLAYGAPPSADGGVVVAIGSRILGFIFTLAGVAAALGGAVVGVKMIVGSTVGSAYATANAILALIGVFGGLALAIAGPEIGAQIVDMTSSLSRAIVVPAGP